MNPPRCPALFRVPNRLVRSGLLGVLICMAGGGPRLLAVDTGINNAIWKMRYGVTDAQLYLNGDPQQGVNTTWLNADDDGDGISNGAEIAAGTNPFLAGSTLKVTSITADTTQVHMTFATESGKQYVAQSTTDLTNPLSWAPVVPAVQVTGDGNPKTLDVPRSGNNAFYRVLVQDLDSDGDNVSDWAETIAGYNKNNAQTNGLTGDQAALTAAIATSNVVTITVTKSSATQPADPVTAAVETGSITISRGGPLRFNTITVPLQKSGTATEGGDYDALPSSVTFGVNQTQTVLTINPKYNSSRRTNVTAIVKALAGGGYSLGAATSGAVVINPTGLTTGTGLTGQYHNQSSSTYSPTQTNIFAGTAEMTRLDPTIDFNGIASISTGNPCTITMVSPHGMVSGTPVLISGVSGGTFSPAINGTYVATVTGTSTFTVPSNCTVAPTSLQTAAVGGVNGITSISVGNPCTVTTKVAHGFSTGNTVTIGWVTNGTFSPSINGIFTVTVTGTNTFTVPSNCTVAPTSPGVSVATVAGTLGVNGWGASTGPLGMSSPATNGLWSARWTGQVMPQYSETYTFDLRTSDSAKLWVNGQLLIDRWASQNVSEFTNTISLKAGVLYDIQIDYWKGGVSSGVGSNAEAHLFWWSPSQTKQIIPQNRLFPAPTQSSKQTAITSALSAVGFVSVPFTFNVASSNIGGSVTYALATTGGPLPPGLSLSSAGVISGTPTAAGTYNVAVNATNVAAGTVTGSSVIDITIFPTGGVTREILSATGDKVSQIVIPPLVPTPTHDTISAIDDDTDYGNNTGERLRGYIVPPKTGNYYFWLAANNAAELWISNDTEYVNRVRRATVTASSGKKVWNAAASQQSQWLALVAGQKYYFEVLHNTGADADDYVSVGWLQDDVGTIPSVTNAPNASAATQLIPNLGGALQGYPLSGTMPSYVFQPYDYPSVTPPDGTLYAGNLGPQGASTTTASGSANLRVNAAGTQGVLHFNYQNLGSPRTAYHLHTDAFGVHPQGEIIFDIDDADTFHPELRTPDGGYIWNFGAVGTFPDAASIVSAIQQGKVYLNIHSVIYPAGEIRGNLTLVDGSQTAPSAASYTEPPTTDSPGDDAQVARFLNQASFGASPADVTFVKNNGFAAWITDQLSKPASHSSNDVVNGLTADINTPYPSTLFTDAWWKYSITGPDQLRQRLAFALSEIMVVSWANNTGPLQQNGRVLADYYDQLVDYCLPSPGLTDSGNFRGILKAVTLTPAMGLYLDMRNNQKGDDSVGRHPNENYAREIMQLFSVGLNRMWDDGRLMLGSDAGLIPTYTQPTILGVSALLTGWGYNQANQGTGRLPANFTSTADYLNPMVLVPTQHDLNAKLLLNNVVVPGATGRTPRVSISSITTGNPCTINTSTIHGLTTGDTIKIANVSGGTFSTGGPINASFQATVTSPTAFTVPVNCTSVSGISYTNATVTGATVTAATFGTGGIAGVTGSQSDNSNFTGWTNPHPYDQYGMTELDKVMDNIVGNDNVPPFICRELIQRFVTSKPSPGYIYRVVQKFKDNGSGVRGDMTAVITQILLDGEARSSTAAFANVKFGKQREPMLRLTGPARAFPALGYTGTYSQLSGVDSSKLRITTSTPNDFSSSFSVSLDFHGNYSPSGQTLTPGNVPTSTAYTVQKSLGITSITAATGAPVAITAISTGNPCTVTTGAAHNLNTGDPVTISGVTGGTFSPAINGTFQVTVGDATHFTVASNCTALPTSLASAQETPQLATVVTQVNHGLTTGNAVTISGVTGGSFTPTLTNNAFTVTVVNATTFTIPCRVNTAPTSVASAQIVGGNTLDVNATGMVNVTYSQAASSNTLTVNTGGPPTNITVPGTSVVITSITTGNPCTVTTATSHNLVTGNLVKISGVADGAFDTAINSTFTATVVTGTTFTVPVNCTADATDGSASKAITSRVYLKFLTQTTGGGAAIPADGIYDVVLTTGSTSFNVVTADTPGTGRGGNVIIPKISSSYTPQTNNTIVQYNNNVNHNLSVNDHIWVDAPVVTSPLNDAEYLITTLVDEDHFKTPSQPVSTNGGTYPLPVNANNGVTIWPLVAPPLGRSGVVNINQSTFNLSSTEGTLTQSPLNSPTVFNFFFPDYKFPGNLANHGVDSPEFQLTTDTNVVNLSNSITNMFIGTGGGNGNLNGLSSFNNGNGQVVMDIGPFMTLAKTSNTGIPGLVDELTNLLVGAPLDANVRTTIINFVANTTNFPMANPTPTNLQMRDRVRAVIHLIITSAEYAVQK